MLADYLDRLEPRLNAMDARDGLAWCDELRRSWSASNLGRDHPDMIARILEIRDRILDKLVD
jgi:hypothetical protein